MAGAVVGARLSCISSVLTPDFKTSGTLKAESAPKILANTFQPKCFLYENKIQLLYCLPYGDV